MGFREIADEKCGKRDYDATSTKKSAEVMLRLGIPGYRLSPPGAYLALFATITRFWVIELHASAFFRG